jgi:hypothetical protein
VAGAGHKERRSEWWHFVHRDGTWLMHEVEQAEEGARHLKAPLVGETYAQLSPESILRERYARGEIEIEQFEREMATLLERGQTY